jgi:hypothetical protein
MPLGILGRRLVENGQSSEHPQRSFPEDLMNARSKTTADYAEMAQWVESGHVVTELSTVCFRL